MKFVLLFSLLLSAVSFSQSNTVNGKGAGITDRDAFKTALRADSHLDVRDFGAIPNDGINDTVAFEAAFTAGVSRGIKRVFIPAGTWVLENCDVPPAFVLFGAGSSGGTAWTGTAIPAPVSRLFPLTSTSTVLRFADLHANTIEDIDIEYVSASVTSTGYGISIVDAVPGTWPRAGFTMRRCSIRNFARGLYGDSPNRIHIEDSHLIQSDYDLYLTGITSTLTAINSELGGIPKDGGNGQAWYLSNTQGANFVGCEFGNGYRVGNIEGSSVVSIVGCNFETVTGPYGIGITTGRLSVIDSSVATITGPFIRNTGSAANIVSFNGFTIRSGGTVIHDGRAVGYETSVDNDFPPCVHTNISCRRTTGDFATVETYWSGDRNPLPFESTPEIQRIELAACIASATSGSGNVVVSPRGVDVFSHTAAGATAVCNLSSGNVYAPVLSRRDDATIGTFDWSRRMVIRFRIQRFDQGSGSTSDNQAVVLFGVPYNRTTSGALAGKGIGIQISDTSVVAVVHNGSAGASVAMGSLADSTKKEVVLDYDGAGTLKASLTGHYDVTRNGGPTGDSATHENSALISAWNTTGGTSIPHYAISDLEIAYY